MIYPMCSYRHIRKPQSRQTQASDLRPATFDLRLSTYDPRPTTPGLRPPTFDLRLQVPVASLLRGSQPLLERCVRFCLSLLDRPLACHRRGNPVAKVVGKPLGIAVPDFRELGE